MKYGESDNPVGPPTPTNSTQITQIEQIAANDLRLFVSFAFQPIRSSPPRKPDFFFIFAALKSV
jgi:hypothetical protein